MSSASFRKEPSMDEILASIRRIIESGDGNAASEPVQAKAADADRESPQGRNSEPAFDGEYRVPRFDVHYLSAVNSERRSAETRDDDFTAATEHSQPQAEAHEEPARGHASHSVSDDWELRSADLDIDRESQANDAYAEARPAHAPADFDAAPGPLHAENENELAADGEAKDEGGRDFSFEFDDAAFEAALHNDTWHGPSSPDEIGYDAEEPHTAELVEPVADASPAPFEPEAIAAPTPRRSAAEMPESVIAGASALLSAQAGDQVAAAFDELTRTIRSGQMRSMEDMARELLRPMLQEWLEDNLPRIVERLVRDEIERIARGPRH